MSFGEKIQNIRKENNLTQEELGEKLYVTRAAVSKWERNLCLPGEDIIEKISEEFHISVDDLLEKKDILRDATRIRKNSKKIVIASVIGGSILLAISIILFILFVSVNTSNEYYALVKDVDERYVYAETKSGNVRLPKSRLKVMEKEEKEDTDALLYDDYGLVTKKNGKFTLEITDHAETENVVPDTACGIVISLEENPIVDENSMSSFPVYYTNYYRDSRVDYDYVTANYFGNYFFATTNVVKGAKLGEEENWNFSYCPEFLGEKSLCYIYYIDGLYQEDGFHLELFQKCYLDEGITLTFTRTNPYVSDSLYEDVSHLKLSFTAVSKGQSLILHQYDENMNLLNTAQVTADYIGEDGFFDSVADDAFYNFLSVDGKITVLGSKEVKSYSSYTDFLPYKTGFYKWSV